MRRLPFRALTALLLTTVGLTISACVVYDDDGPRHRHGEWGFRDDHRYDHHRGWR